MRCVRPNCICAISISTLLNKIADIIGSDEHLGEVIGATLEMSAVTNLKAFDTAPKLNTSTRNYDKFAVNGVGRYGKGKMVEAVVNTYVQNNPTITINALKEVFPHYLLKGYGVIRTEDGTIKDYKRFYKSALPDGTVFYICSQWGKDNTDNFVQYVNKNVVGIKVTNVE